MATIFDDRLWSLVPPYFRTMDKYAASTRDGTEGYLEAFYDALDSELALWKEDTIDVVRDAGDGDVADGLSLILLASKLGFTLPAQGSGFPYLRRFLAQSAPFREWKGNYDLLPSAIFIATGLHASLVIPAQDVDVFTVAESYVAYASMGWDTRPEAQDTFIVGESSVGTDNLGTVEINPEIPYTIFVDLLYQPDAKTQVLLEWVIGTFKRAVDIPVYRYPTATSTWIVGVSRVGVDTLVGSTCFTVAQSQVGLAPICGGPYPDVLRITLPDGTQVGDL